MWLKSLDKHRNDVRQAQVALEKQRDGHALYGASRLTYASHMTHRRWEGGLHHHLKRLDGILGFDESGRCLWAEPGVTMDRLVKWTLKRGLAPEVVPEFKGISVGGAIMGAGLESSSFRFGQFNDGCEAYELMLGDGTLEKVTEETDSDLFYGLSGSYGSLASLTLAKIRLRSIEPWVRVEYDVAEDFEEAMALLSQGAETYPDFLEGVVLHPHAILIMRGHLTSHTRGQEPVRLGRFWDPWFIQHLKQKQTWDSDLFPVYDYLFRFDQGAFWMGRFATHWRHFLAYLVGSQAPSYWRRQIEEAPNTLSPSSWFRGLFGWRFSSSQLYHALHRMPAEIFEETFLVHDYYIPRARVVFFLQFLAQHAGVYPLWLCPIRGTGTGQFLSPHFLGGQESTYPIPDFINVGVYGVPKKREAAPELSRELERLCAQLGGRKMLYSLCGYAEEEFWSLYDRSRYQELRNRCAAPGYYQDLYEKKRLVRGNERKARRSAFR